jgi:glycolate oxidase FAD binding subunit
VTNVLRPTEEQEIARLLAGASARGEPVEIGGNGTKRKIGRPIQAAHALTLQGLSEITLYEPTEMVMSARAGTPLAVIEQALASHRQCLAFEPLDLGAALGVTPHQATIGGVFATNLSGARRISAGATRDHLLGVRAVTGSGEIVKSGGRVMKNVTGYDVARALAGSWGTLAVMTEVTFKVAPVAEETATLVLFGLPDAIGVEVLCLALGTPFEVSGTVHLDPTLAQRLRTPELAGHGKAVTALRLENFSKSIAYRGAQLKDVLNAYGEIHTLDHAGSEAFWRDIAELAPFSPTAGNSALWRISTRPTLGVKLVEALKKFMPCTVMYDWSGGLIWLEVPGEGDACAADVRRLMASYDGHATLIRAEPAVRASLDVFQPLEPGLDAIQRRLKETFDPAGILNPARMYAAY